MTGRQSRILAVTVETGAAFEDIEATIERGLAIDSLLDDNYFELVDRQAGPYRLTMSAQGGRLALQVSNANNEPIVAHLISMRPLMRVLREYHMICDAHVQATSYANVYRIETLDMGRRALHNDGSELLMSRLANKIRLDHDTARRIFTLISVTWGAGLSSRLFASSQAAQS